MRKNKDVISKWIVKTDMGILCHSTEAFAFQHVMYDPKWTNDIYSDLKCVHMFDSHEMAQLAITAYISQWSNVRWAKVAELKIEYLGTVEDITERELLEESIYHKRDD